MLLNFNKKDYENNFSELVKHASDGTLIEDDTFNIQYQSISSHPRFKEKNFNVTDFSSLP